jgi:hypothetical protein
MSKKDTGSSGAVYGLGLLGALGYFWQEADGFWGHVWAVGESVLWPLFLVYRAFQGLG